LGKIVCTSHIIKKAFYALFAFAFGSAILITSVFRSASIRYSFRLPPSPLPESEIVPKIDYQLPNPGRIQPFHLLWPAEVIRDRLWLFVTQNPLKKAQINLLIADKRLASAQQLIAQSKPELAISVAAKAEIYLVRALSHTLVAKDQGMEVDEFLYQLSFASLKHRSVLETIRAQAPEDAQPIIIEILDQPKGIYEQTCHKLQEIGQCPPDNPFE